MLNFPVLPFDRLTDTQMKRLADELQAASEAGVDLGLRRAQADAGADALRELVAALCLAVDEFAAERDPADLASRDAVASLRQYIADVERLMARATGDTGDVDYSPAPEAGTSVDR